MQCRPAPEGEEHVSRQGPSERPIFYKAIERGNLLIAETSARQMGRLSLVESLALTALIAQKDARRRSRVAARWLLRYLETHDQATIEEASLVASALTVLGGPGHDEAYAALLALAETGSRRRIGSPV